MDSIQKHSERQHALLSASSAERWINCTPSAVLEDEFGEKKSTIYSEEGTLAHEIAELSLKHSLSLIDEPTYLNLLNEYMDDPLYNDEMANMLHVYTDYCFETYTGKNQASIYLEDKLDLSEYIPEGFGTADCIIIDTDSLEIIDLKWGKGVKVSPNNNKQLMIYALGALIKYDVFGGIKNIKLTIIQPRLDYIESFTIDIVKLTLWADRELKQKAHRAFYGLGDPKVGDWCKFCSIKHICRAFYNSQMEIAKYEFKTPDFLTDEEISDILSKAHIFTEWLNSISEYALNKAIQDDKQWPGFKLVEGISRRKWIDETNAAKTILEKLPELNESQIYKTSLQSITTLEKLIGRARFNTLFSDLTIKPQGKPTLAPIDDKRDAIGYNQAKIDFQ